MQDLHHNSVFHTCTHIHTHTHTYTHAHHEYDAGSAYCVSLSFTHTHTHDHHDNHTGPTPPLSISIVSVGSGEGSGDEWEEGRQAAVSLVHFANGDLVLVREEPGSSAQVQVLSEGVSFVRYFLVFSCVLVPPSVISTKQMCSKQMCRK